MHAVLRAGVKRVELRPPIGMAMMGYGARRGTATGFHDPLHARALFFANGAGAGAAPKEREGRALIVETDLCLVGVLQANALRDRIAGATGLARGEILLGCTHTHSGPETGLSDALAGRPESHDVATLFDAVVRAAVGAVERARPARIGVGTAALEIGRNRRVADGPVDPDALVVRVDTEDGAPLSVLYVHGCHPTVLGHDNLAYSADWPGAASRRIEAEIPGAIAVFALGAHADVDPRTRGLLDLAIPDQSVGAGFDEVEKLGNEAGDAIARAVRALSTRSDVAVGAASAAVELTTHGSADVGARERHLARLRADALDALDLPRDAPATTNDLYRISAEGTLGLAPEDARARVARVRRYLRDRTAPRIAGGARADVEVQVVRLGPVWLLGVPLEATVDVGREWRERAGAGGEARVISIANGWLRYLPHARNFEAPLALQKYEILQSTFEAGAAEALVRRALGLKEELAAR